MSRDVEVFIKESIVEWEDLGGGIRRKILGYDPHLMMTIVEFKKGSIGYVHKHPHTQVSYVEQGSFEVQIGSEKKILQKGDCYFVPSNIEHGVVALEEAALLDIFTPAREDILREDK